MVDVASLVMKVDSSQVATATKDLDALTTSAEQAGYAFGRTFGFAMTAVAGATVLMAKSAITSADAMYDLHLKTGLAYKELAAYDELARQSGASSVGLAQGFKQLSKYMVEHGDKLRSIGVTSKSSSEAMLQFADVIAGIRDPALRSALAQEVLGRSGTNLIPALIGGRKAILDAQQSTAEYGAKLEEVAPKADEFNDNLEKLQTQAKLAGMSIAAELLPPLNALVTEFLRAKKESGAIASFFSAIGVSVWSALGSDMTQAGVAASELNRLLLRQADLYADIDKQVKGGGDPTAERAQLVLIKDEIRVQEARLAFLKAPDVKGSTTADEKAVRKLIQPKGAKEKIQELKDYDQHVKDFAKMQDKAIAEITASAQEAQRIIADIDPIYKATLAWNDLTALIEKGFITAEQAGQYYAKSFGESTDQMTEFARRAGENIQDAFSEFLFDPFKGGLDGMLQGFTLMLRKMAAEALAAQILGAVGNWGKTGGGAGSMLGGIAAAMFGGGVGAAAGSGASFTDTGGFAQMLGSFAGGGFTGSGPRSGGVDGIGGFPAILHPNETVIDHTKNQNNTERQPNQRAVTVINQFTISTPTDRRTQEQIATMAGMSIQNAMARGA